MSGENFQQRASKFFDAADTDGTGALSPLELCKVVINSGCNKPVAEIAEWFDEIDKDDDGNISRQEFLDSLSKIPASDIKEADLRDAFAKLDLDGSGKITEDEVRRVYADITAGKEIAMDLDIDGDGKVSYEEFLKKLKET